MATTADLLTDAFGRLRRSVRGALDGLTAEQLAYRPDPQANSVAWLVWHLTRVQDDHVADAAGLDQVWTGDGWSERFGLALPDGDTGYGHSSAEVEQVRVDEADLLRGYFEATHRQTVAFVSGLTDDDLDAVVDEAYDPPVTLAVRLVSVVNDDMQHVGQAAYVAGLARHATGRV